MRDLLLSLLNRNDEAVTVLQLLPDEDPLPYTDYKLSLWHLMNLAGCQLSIFKEKIELYGGIEAQLRDHVAQSGCIQNEDPAPFIKPQLTYLESLANNSEK